LQHFMVLKKKSMTKEQIIEHVKDIVNKFDVNGDRKISR